MKCKKVLVADDSPKLLSALRIQLEAHGFDVVTSTDAYMALEQARQHKPDVMILDIRMPAGDGFNLLERVRKIAELQHIPIIYITGDQSPELDLKAQRLGACGLIHKPIVLSALINLIDSAIHGSHDFESGSVEPKVYHIPSEIDLSGISGV